MIFFLNDWDLNFFINWIIFWIIFYEIDTHLNSHFTSLIHTPCIRLCAQVLGDFCTKIQLGPLISNLSFLFSAGLEFSTLDHLDIMWYFKSHINIYILGYVPNRTFTVVLYAPRPLVLWTLSPVWFRKKGTHHPFFFFKHFGQEGCEFRKRERYTDIAYKFWEFEFGLKWI